MKTDCIPFTEEMIPEAGSLLAERHKRNRAGLPVLPPRFEVPSVATQAVQALWHRKFKRGYAALRDGKLVAYLLGDFTLQPWGRCGYIHLPGYALAEGESTEVIQDLYALLGDDWVKNGIFSHAIYVAAADTHLIAAFFSLGFGKERVDGLMDLRSLVIPEVELPSGIAIRRAGPGDNDRLGSLSHIIMSSLANAPYWHPTLPEDWEELRQGWAELAEDEEWTVWMALDNTGQVLGTIAFHPEREDELEMLVSPRTTTFTVAATRPEARGRGIGTALTWHGLAHVQREGYEICYTDWISPNLPASRFWPRFGLKDAAYRLAKRVDPMIAWTRR